jgi:hypothetical protein
MIRRLWRVWWDYDPGPAEFLLGLFTGLWGLWVLLPWQPATFAVGVAFRGLVSTGVPEEVWGAFALSIAVLRLLALGYDRRRARAGFSLLAGGFWLTVSWSVVTNTFTSTGTVIYPLLTLACFGVYLRLKRAGV